MIIVSDLIIFHPHYGLMTRGFIEHHTAERQFASEPTSQRSHRTVCISAQGRLQHWPFEV
jgi:hypothetical protein